MFQIHTKFGREVIHNTIYSAGITLVTIIATVIFWGIIGGIFRMTGRGLFCFTAIIFNYFLVTAFYGTLSKDHLLGKNKNTQPQNNKKYSQSSRHAFAKLININDLTLEPLNLLN